jgi:hypothetical protein
VTALGKPNRRQVLLGGALFALLRASHAQEPERRREIDMPRYDQDYPGVGYSRPAKQNRIWRLQQRLASGQQVLDWESKSGYVRSLLAALEIGADSQVVVFSKTSLQTELITERTPRAIYSTTTPISASFRAAATSSCSASMRSSGLSSMRWKTCASGRARSLDMVARVSSVTTLFR